MSPRRETSDSFRILHVITPSRMAGAETLLARLALRQMARGHPALVLSTRQPAVVDQFISRGIVLCTAPIGGKANPLALPALSQAVRQLRPTHLHSHLSTASWWCGWLERLGGPPSLGHVHGFTSAAWHRQQRLLLAVSQAVKDHLIDEGIAADRIRVLHNPVDPDDVKPRRPSPQVRADMATDDDAPVVGSFAHFSEKKGWRDLVEAVPHVLRRFPATVFWFVGDGPLRAEMERRAAELGCAKSIRLPGFRSDVADLMNAVDVMALPSHREPFGLVYVEAALLRKPAIACNSGGAPEVVREGETGLLVAPRDVHQLENAICSLLEDHELASRLGRCGREEALARFNWNRYLDSLEAIYAEMPTRAP